jgi:hypothetical protein
MRPDESSKTLQKAFYKKSGEIQNRLFLDFVVTFLGVFRSATSNQVCWLAGLLLG